MCTQRWSDGEREVDGTARANRTVEVCIVCFVDWTKRLATTYIIIVEHRRVFYHIRWREVAPSANSIFVWMEVL